MPKSKNNPKEFVKPGSTKRQERRERRKEASAKRREIRRQKLTRWIDKLIGRQNEE